MSDTYTPSLSQVREQYARGARSGYGGSAEAGAYRLVNAQNEFDRWLSAVVQQAKAEQREEDARAAQPTWKCSYCGYSWPAGEGNPTGRYDRCSICGGDDFEEHAAIRAAGGSDE